MFKRIVCAALLSSLAPAVHAGSSESVTLEVKGMTCATCPVAVKAVLKKHAGVADVKVDFKKGTAEIIFDSSKVTPQKLAQAVTEAGFPSTARK